MARRPGKTGDDTPKVAIVLSGAVARGAFQAGALAELVPALERDGLTPSIWLGTSAGSINAALWGQSAHLGAVSAGAQVLDVWRRMSDDDVFEPLVSASSGRTLVRSATGFLGWGPGPVSLLDTSPLRRTAQAELGSGQQLAANVEAGVVSAVGVVTTRMPASADSTAEGAASGRSVLFLDEHHPGDYAGDPERALDVVRGPLTADHVLASSAFPVAFPPVRIDAPEQAVGWYLDGGVRLNAPLHPAVHLGATKIVYLSATATRYGPPPLPDPTRASPDLADAAAQIVHAVLADRGIEDLTSLRRTNRLVQQAARSRDGARLRDRNGRAYRPIEFMAVSPPPGTMGRIAARIFRSRTAGLGRITEFDNWFIGQVIRAAGDDVGRRELLSYLFFDEEYFEASIELGRQAAATALRAGWRTDEP